MVLLRSNLYHLLQYHSGPLEDISFVPNKACHHVVVVHCSLNNTRESEYGVPKARKDATNNNGSSGIEPSKIQGVLKKAKKSTVERPLMYKSMSAGPMQVCFSMHVFTPCACPTSLAFAGIYNLRKKNRCESEERFDGCVLVCWCVGVSVVRRGAVPLQLTSVVYRVAPAVEGPGREELAGSGAVGESGDSGMVATCVVEPE
jgi:hypothetical protein